MKTIFTDDQKAFLLGMPFIRGWAVQTVAALHVLAIRKPQRSTRKHYPHRRHGR